jgi:hypothetical protein
MPVLKGLPPSVVLSPRKVWGPQTNDLVPQLRKRRTGKVILGGSFKPYIEDGKRLESCFEGEYFPLSAFGARKDNVGRFSGARPTGGYLRRFPG